MMKSSLYGHSMLCLTLLLSACGSETSDSDPALPCDTNGAEMRIACESDGWQTMVCEDNEWKTQGACLKKDESEQPKTEVCTSGATLEESNACGPNNSGLLTKVCNDDGQWVETCNSKDVCENGDLREDLPCGPDNQSTQQAKCVDGQWVASSLCEAFKECEPTDEAQSQSCGVHGNGTQTRACTDEYTWENWSDCHGDVACLPDDTPTPNDLLRCGIQSAGTLNVFCNDDGQWQADPNAECEEFHLCDQGETEPRACGYNLSGTQSRTCNTSAEQWVWNDDWSTCENEDECEIGDTSGSISCGIENKGTLPRFCNDDGQWQAVPDAECEEFHLCNQGSFQNERCGTNQNGYRTRSCNTSGEQWTWNDDDWSECQDPDACDKTIPPFSVNCTLSDGTTGLNGNAAQQASCEQNSQGAWELHHSSCIDPDECKSTGPESEQSQFCTLANGTTGLNGRAEHQRTCVFQDDHWKWSDWSECVDNDECVAGEAEERVCWTDGGYGGYNGNARETKDCILLDNKYQWARTWSRCHQDDECVADRTRKVSCFINGEMGGHNGDARSTDTCLYNEVHGYYEWTETDICRDPDECVIGDKWETMYVCGHNQTGLVEVECRKRPAVWTYADECFQTADAILSSTFAESMTVVFNKTITTAPPVPTSYDVNTKSAGKDVHISRSPRHFFPNYRPMLLATEMPFLNIEPVPNGSNAHPAVNPDHYTAGRDHICMIYEGIPYCSGDNSEGQLGRPNGGLWPQHIGGTDPAYTSNWSDDYYFTQIAAGDTFTCGIVEGIPYNPGSLYCWGYSRDRAYPKNPDNFNWELTFVDNHVSQIAAGEGHLCVVLDVPGERDNVYCRGKNTGGQVDVTSSEIWIHQFVLNEELSTKPHATASIEKIYAGANYTLVLWKTPLSGGGHTYYLTGSGRLSGADPLPKKEYTQIYATVQPAHDVFRVYTSSRSICIEVRGPKFLCMGDNSFGTISETLAHIHTFQEIPASLKSHEGTHAVQIALGDETLCALMSDQRVRCRGRNSSGQLGIGVEPSFIRGTNNEYMRFRPGFGP